MKSLFVFLAAIGLSLVPFACGTNNYPTSTYMTPMPTTTPGPAAAVTVSATGSYGSYAYSTGSITIMHGQSVMWDTSNSIHPLNIDNGSGSCLVSGDSSFPYTYTFTTAGTYHFHCGVHSTCGSGTCPNPSTCTGMVGTITVN
jgi:plastocyanin